MSYLNLMIVIVSDGLSGTLDELPGTLYWADWPDPKSTRPVNSRSAASIDNERGLCTLMRSMGYKHVNFLLSSIFLNILLAEETRFP